MSTTSHLALPLLAAAQAQKHVTHNEALASLDALVHLAVKERHRTTPPAAPQEGERYLVGAGAGGSFQNREGEIALFDLGVWRFFTPRAGWRIYVEAEDAFLIHDGTDWYEIGHYVRGLEVLDRLGIGTTADDLNRFAARLNAALFDARTVDQGGTGDLRLVLNKPESRSVLSLLFQTRYGGRAEAGLVGNDDFSLRISSDGENWRDALVVDNRTGAVSFPHGVMPAGANLLMNASFAVNQRGFAGGPLPAGAYGFDRWRGGMGGATLSRGSDGTISLTGSIEQIVDVALAEPLLGAPHFGGCTLTLSVEDLSQPCMVMIGTKEATLPAGPGRSSVSVTLESSETSHVRCALAAGTGVTFKRIKLESGPYPTPWQRELPETEEARCRRYYQRLLPVGGAPGILPVLGQRKSTNVIDLPLTFPIAMRAAPTLAASSFSWASAAPVGSQIGFLDGGSGGWVGQTGGVTATMAAAPTASAAILRFQAGAAFSGTAGSIGNLYLGASASLGLQAEI
ncbi:DUF2793 domain-containing protein [Microvirga puerhi]|uniref:DUF2793 domain-containing protein n=1 Tax=Microvirga puerhi TaxID=2876078 RepID=A0ABS7VLM7_9HYPH|nr:DUF2793 domain-containing protein [Microvirga puerhi]MBZ6076421.1 DUF2793 domain-containing protein [Microvirga puerhi]